jgi:hypothetical protein
MLLREGRAPLDDANPLAKSRRVSKNTDAFAGASGLAFGRFKDGRTVSAGRPLSSDFNVPFVSAPEASRSSAAFQSVFSNFDLLKYVENPCAAGTNYIFIPRTRLPANLRNQLSIDLERIGFCNFRKVFRPFQGLDFC